MSKIKITADSTADLGHLFEERNIPVMPLYVSLEGKDYRDGVDINPQMIFDVYDEKGILPKSAAVNPDEYIDFFNKHKEGGYEVIHFVVSGELSLSYGNAQKAAEEVGGVYVIDSRTLSSGIGLMALKALDLVNEGKPAAEIVDKMNELAKHHQSSFVVNNLEFLHKGGRCSGVQKILAGILKIRPVLQLVDGKIVPARKYKFSGYSKSIARYVEETIQQFSTPDYTRMFITHSGVDQELIDDVKAQIKTLAPQFKEIHVTQAGSTITVHCGKGTLGILYLNKQ